MLPAIVNVESRAAGEQMNFSKHILTIAIIVTLVACKPSVKVVEKEDQAIDIVASAIKSDHLYPDIKDDRCLAYIVDNVSNKDYEISVHENHNKGCGGDPDTFPTRDRFLVTRQGGQLRIYDDAEDKFVAYSHKRG
jgi:hypothetical protein